MAKVVGAELDLVSVGGETSWLGHDSGIVDQEIKSVGGGEILVGRFFDGFEAGEVELEEGDVLVRDDSLDVADCGLSLGRDACR